MPVTNAAIVQFCEEENSTLPSCRTAGSGSRQQRHSTESGSYLAVFFSYNKSANNTFYYGLSSKQTITCSFG
jgi:hypothetical protein